MARNRRGSGKNAMIAAQLWSGARAKTVMPRVVETVEAKTADDVVDCLERIDAERRRPGTGDIPWQSGWVCWIAYDFGIDRIGARARRKPRVLPMARFHRVDAETHAGRFEGRHDGAAARRAPTCALIGRSDTRSSYVRKVADAQDELRAGNAFEINLSQRWTWRFARKPDAFGLFRDIGAAIRPRFGFFEQTGNSAILGFSPELFLSVSGRKITAAPIKGTAARGQRLLTSEKDRAELLMVTDLFRNDLGKICDAGSVRATGPHELLLPYVRHLYARVDGRLRKNAKLTEILLACFPSGSVTGAPKIAACRIIDRIEPFAREEAFGTVGWIGRTKMTFAVSIRTAMLQGRDLRYTAGGGITVYSDPEKEYEETLIKARRLMSCLPIRNDTDKTKVKPWPRTNSNNVHE